VTGTVGVMGCPQRADNLKKKDCYFQKTAGFRGGWSATDTAVSLMAMGRYAKAIQPPCFLKRLRFAAMAKVSLGQLIVGSAKSKR
jgi:hypothetical protein